MFSFFKIKSRHTEARIDVTPHIAAARRYIFNHLNSKYGLSGNRKTNISSEESDIKYSVRDPDVQYSVRDYGDSIYVKAHAFLRASQTRPSFNEMVLNEIKEQGLSPKEFYSRAGLDRKLFSSIKNGGYNYQPSRNTAIRCCFALHLPYERTEIFLKAAGYALSDTKRQDLILRYCIENKIWSIFDVDELLDALGESILFK